MRDTSGIKFSWQVRRGGEAMSVNQLCTKCVVCDWEIKDEDFRVSYGDKQLKVCSDECVDKFNKTPAKYVHALLISICLGLGSNPALAQSADDAYKIIVAERQQLASRYDATARDVDDLEKKISLLKRDSSQEAKRAETELDKRLSAKSRDLKDLEYQIQDLDQVLKKS